MKCLSILTIAANSIAMSHIMIQNYTFCENLKKLKKLIHVVYLVCQLFIHVIRIKMDRLALLAIIFITIDKFYNKYGHYDVINIDCTALLGHDIIIDK